LLSDGGTAVGHRHPEAAVDLIVTILLYIVIGAVIGLIARALLPGRDAMSLPATILLGIAGAVIGGIVGDALNGSKENDGVQWILSVVAAIGLLLLFRMFSGRNNRSRSTL
jgi:uncharacterized membrane protein YeaQ/YmgE (transglycosylase-associated protein family)